MNWLLLSLLTLSTQAYAMGFGFCEGERSKSRAEQLALLNPKFDLEIADLELFSGASMVGGYEYEVEPAFTQGLYARSDRWYIGVNLTPLFNDDAGEAGEYNLSLGPRSSMRASFIRFDSNACRAQTLKPRSPRSIPLKAHKALDPNFMRSDYFLFEASLGFVASTEMLNILTASNLGLNLSAQYLVEGSYQIHLVKLDDERVRLKVLTRKGREISAGLRVGPSSELEVFEISQLNRLFKKHLNPNPIRLRYARGRSNILLADYTLKLTDPEIARAFDETLALPLSFKNIQLANPFSRNSDIEGQLILNLTALEELHQQDQRNGRSDRIQRTLRAQGQQQSSGVDLGLGNKLLGFDFDAIASTSKITLRDAQDAKTHYLMRSFERTREARLAFGWAQTFDRRTTEVLLKANSDFSQLDAMNVVRVLERRDHKLRMREFRKITQRLRLTLPREVFEKLPLNQWSQRVGETRRNFGLLLEMILGPEVLTVHSKLSSEQMEVLYRDYLLAQGIEAQDLYSPTQDETSEERLVSSLKAVAQKLSFISDSSHDDLERLEVFADLRRNELFNQTGMGFLLKLNPQQSSYLKLTLSSSEQNLSFTQGHESIAQTYRNLVTVRALLQTDNFDLRREAENLFSVFLRAN